jgi:hypothetical protein
LRIAIDAKRSRAEKNLSEIFSAISKIIAQSIFFERLHILCAWFRRLHHRNVIDFILSRGIFGAPKQDCRGIKSGPIWGDKFHKNHADAAAAMVAAHPSACGKASSAFCVRANGWL